MELAAISGETGFLRKAAEVPVKGVSISNPFPAEGSGPVVPPGGAGEGDFGGKLEKALAEIDARNREADSAAYRYASGENIPVHKVIIAAEQARLSIALAAEVRNRVLEAYQELTRTAG